EPRSYEGGRGTTHCGQFIAKEKTMKRLVVLTGLCLVLLAFASPALAQAPQEKPPVQVAMWIAITAGFAMAIASAFCGIAQARACAAACEGLARNPGAAPPIRFALILALVLIESLALYTFAIVFLIIRPSAWW
ncbi:MAG: ATP synthase F0 subunit C, partial [Terriglobia bacterium]